MFEPHHHDQTELFQLALGLCEPWQVRGISFCEEQGRLDIHLSYRKETKFPCPECAQRLSVYDTVERTWKHLNFFQYETYLHVGVPRVQCAQCQSTKNVEVPWARANSGFTLLFEALVMELATVMPLSVVGSIVNEYDKRLMRIVDHYVHQARSEVDMTQVRQIGVDETSKAKGHDYISTFIDLASRRVLFVTAGKDSTTVERFAQELGAHQGDSQQIAQVCADLSPAYQKGVADHLVEAELVFDRFHVMKLVNEAVDSVRRQEQKEHPLLKGSRYAWLHNPETATKKQTQQLKTLTKLNLKTVRAYQVRRALRDIYELTDPKEAQAALKRWYFWATHSRIQPIIKVAKTIKKHWDGVLNFFQDRIANGLAEGINSVIQTIKRRARGYRNTDHFITMIYLVCGKLPFNLPKVCGVTHGR